MIITTTPNIEGKNIREYKGIVTAKLSWAPMFLGISSPRITDIVGGRSAAYERELSKGRTVAIEEMSEKAKELGCDAIVGVDLDYEFIRNGIVMSVSGTAVRLG